MHLTEAASLSSAAAATATYAWPIAPWLDGHLQVAVGNVFGTHLDDLRMLIMPFRGRAFDYEEVADPGLHRPLPSVGVVDARTLPIVRAFHTQRKRGTDTIRKWLRQHGIGG